MKLIVDVDHCLPIAPFNRVDSSCDSDHRAATMVDLIIHDVPDSTRAALAREARRRGLSFEDYLRDVLDRWAASSHNLAVIADVERDLAIHGGGGPDAPSSAQLIREARAERDEALYRAATGEPMPDAAKDPLLRDDA